MYLIMMVPAYGAPQGVVPVENGCGYRWDTIYKHTGLGRGNPQSGITRAPAPAFIYLHTPPCLILCHCLASVYQLFIFSTDYSFLFSALYHSLLCQNNSI